MYGDTLPQVLDRAYIKPDRMIKWTQPSFPVLPASMHDSSIPYDLAKPARPGQLLATIKLMGESRRICKFWSKASFSANGSPALGSGQGQLSGQLLLTALR